ncbi:MAG: hypothetical protein HYR76_13950 [Ignavibacteria bacterium]|nr:hypothetical protein [Ignavibacteria bacterium]MBI3766535.1 hypothetical protein [Ignavibacteriales bacterium]
MRILCVVLLLVVMQQVNEAQQTSTATGYKIEYGRIFFTIDEGRAWSEMPVPFKDVLLIAWNNTKKPYSFLAAIQGRLYRMCGDCKHWDVALDVSPYFIPQKLIVSAANPHEMWLAGTQTNMTEVFYSFDGGAVWSPAVMSGQPIENLHLDPADKRKAWFSPIEKTQPREKKP